MRLVLPTGVYCVMDDVKIFLQNTTDEEDFDVVFDGNELRVVDPRLFRYLLTLRIDSHTDRLEPEWRFTLK